MSNPVAYQGRGTIIAFTPPPVTGGSVYTALPQLEKFERASSKVDFDDATCLDSPGVNKFQFPVAVDNGKYQGEGVYDPQNPAITALQSYMQAMTQIGYKITLVDGTIATGLCYVEMFEAPKIDRYKFNRYQFGIMIFGVETLTPLGGSGIAE